MLPGYVCYGSKFGIATLVVSDRFFKIQRSCGKTMLFVYCVPTLYDEYIAMVKTGNECQLSAYMLFLGKFSIVVCFADVLFKPSFSHVVNKLPAELWHGMYHGT